MNKVNVQDYKFVAISYDGEEYWFAASGVGAARTLAADWFGKRGKTARWVMWERDYLDMAEGRA